MSLGSSLYHARKKSGLSQENVAEKLGVSRQTISKWETDETLPDIRQSKGLAMLYHMTLDELIQYDLDEAQAQQMIDSVSDEAQARIDWSKVWSKKYPVLATYHQKVRIEDYAPPLREMLTRLRVEYGYSSTDAVLVLKDILARVWKGQLD
ncbi:helix-turn-helix transcriptional regulator [uncultured Flavonifractor sp.]|uniref:helix-turn-helix transcriptional regulator n=1 Tax=uncultured Flavonifractor sp. TaxID=1193534 RepID=UPI00260E807C|nr:helix-turn-helix domain-containing protein [uncultured Flavonifractor sp.]